MNKTKEQAKAEKDEAKKWAKLFTKYIIDCCLYWELDCRRRPKEEFDAMALDIFSHWEQFEHHCKHLVDPERLIDNTCCEVMEFPKILRNITCHIAKRYVGNPMSGRSDEFIRNYIENTTPKEADVKF